MGRECLIGAPGPTQTQATTSRESRAAGSVLFQSQTIIIDLSVTRNLSIFTKVLFRMLSHRKALQIVNVISLINL